MQRKDYSTREMAKILKRNGFHHERSSGGHKIYKRGGTVVALNNNTNQMVWLRIMKENNLVVK